MRIFVLTFVAVTVLCAMAACQAPPQYHPWGVGAASWWDNVHRGF